jgi:hypothetical protein
MCAERPTLLISINGLEERLMNIEVWTFDKTICARVVTTDMNVIYLVLVGEIRECFEEGWTVICDNFSQRTPSAENIFKNPIA